MGATSVTGVGVGSSEKSGLKGPGNLRNHFVPVVSPHVVCAGTVTASSNVLTVTFPTPLSGGGAKYVVMLTVVDSAINASDIVVTAKTDNTDGDFESFAIATQDAAQVVDYMVVSKGVA